VLNMMKLTVAASVSLSTASRRSVRTDIIGAP
jgi:hypothetical protein